MSQAPLSAYQETLGMLHFARMLDKIRLHATGVLREDFHANLGKGFDGRCVDFLRVAYPALVARVAEGGSDEDILRWCQQNGRSLDENDVFIWNGFVRKAGWNDGGSEMLARRKQESGLGDREEIQTFLEYFEYDEGRKS